MDYLKNIAVGLLAGLGMLALLALMLVLGVVALETLDWLERTWPGSAEDCILVFGACALLALAWAVGRNLRAKPSNA